MDNVMIIRVVSGFLAVVIAAFVAKDASRRGMNAVGWFLGALFLLLIALPLYFILRKPLLPQYQPQFPQPQLPAKLCENCGKYSAHDARFCTQCGQGFGSQTTSAPITVSVPGKSDTNTTRNVIITAFLILLFLMFLIAAFTGSPASDSTVTTLSTIENKVTADAVEQYQIAKRDGNRVDVCVHAGLVKAAYLQAKDEENYKAWVRTERTDCAEAGVNLP